MNAIAQIFKNAGVTPNQLKVRIEAEEVAATEEVQAKQQQFNQHTKIQST